LFQTALEEMKIANDSKYLLVKGCAGLGNRIFTLLCAIEYAKKTNRKLIIDWGDGGYFHSNYNFFSDYFELDSVVYDAPKNLEDFYQHINLFQIME